MAMYCNYCPVIEYNCVSFLRPTKGMVALVEEGLRHRKEHQPTIKDIRLSGVDTRLEYNEQF